MATTRETDAQLVARCRAGDEEAWRELVDRFSRYVYAIAVQGFRLSRADAEDVFQEVVRARVRAAERSPRRRRDQAVARAADAPALHRPLQRASAREQPSEEEAGDGGDDTLARLDEAMAVHEALAHLPEHCQDILDRFFARDESYRTIGEALEIPSGTIASRISRCLAKLRENLEGRNSAPGQS